jgi:hypothetical protein
MTDLFKGTFVRVDDLKDGTFAVANNVNLPRVMEAVITVYRKYSLMGQYQMVRVSREKAEQYAKEIEDILKKSPPVNKTPIRIDRAEKGWKLPNSYYEKGQVVQDPTNKLQELGFQRVSKVNPTSVKVDVLKGWKSVPDSDDPSFIEYYDSQGNLKFAQMLEQNQPVLVFLD